MTEQRHFRPRTLVRGLAWDIGLPLVCYYGLHAAGFSDWGALLGATLAAGLRLAWSAVRQRTLNPFAAVMLIIFGLGLALSFASGDARFLLLKDSITTAAVGTTFLVTAVHGRRPLTLAAQQSWQPAEAARLDEAYRSNPLVRRGHRLASTVWGVGLLAEAAVRVLLVYLLPISVMVGLSSVLMVVVIGGLIAWTVRYARKAAAAGRAAPALG